MSPETAPDGGALVVVATPIGNLADLSPRASEALAGAELICCEDTRRTGKLLAATGIGRRPLRRFDDHASPGEVATIVDQVAGGARVVLVSDAGMPGIADPGERLVAAVGGAGHRVEVIPGPSAALAGLVSSGLPTGRFSVEGFLPRSGKARRDRLAVIAGATDTVVIFEAPHRLVRLVDELVAGCGDDRRVVIARELTKRHEEVWRGTLGGARDDLAAREPRGEYVVVLAGTSPPAPPDDDAVRAALAEHRAVGASTRDAVAAVAHELGVAKRHVYDLAIEGDAPAGEQD